MTAQQLIHKFNTEFGIYTSWPSTYEVDAETYANVCQAVFVFNAKIFENSIVIRENGRLLVQVAIGPNNGILIKDVELILK